MAQTLGTSGIFFDELDDSPSFSGDLSSANFVATQRGLGNWSDINALTNYLMAPSLVFGELFGVFAGAGYPDNANLRCTHFDIVPADTISGISSGGVNLHNFCFWTIKYQNIRVPINNQTNDPVAMLSHEWDIGGEFIVPSNLALRWAGQAGDDTPAPGDARGGIFVPTQEISITWPRLPVGSAPFQAIRALAGKVNNAPMIFDTGVVPFETGLFLGARVRADSMSDGTRAFSLTYKFSQKQVVAADAGIVYGGALGTQSLVGGWNHFFRSTPNKCGFWRLRLSTAVNESKNIYQLGNMALLFQPDQTVSEGGT